MAELEILHHPSPLLKQQAQAVDHFDRELLGFAKDLQQTLLTAPGCVGIAAPQVGDNRRLIIMNVAGRKKSTNHGLLVLVNPILVESAGSVLGREGCLSVPDYTGNVVRSEKIQVSAQDVYGQHSHYEFAGFEARVAQHEIDHLHGLLFLDRLVNRRRDLFRRRVYQ